MALTVDLDFHDPLLDRQGLTWFLESASRGDVTGLMFVISAKGAPINVPDSKGWSPLMWACGRALGYYQPSHIEANQHGAVMALLYNGADPNQADEDGHTPLMQAASRNWPAVCTLLLEHGADPLAVAKNGDTAHRLALTHAAQEALLVIEPAVAYARRTHLTKLNKKRRRPSGPKPKM